MSDNFSKERILKNSLLLYIRMFFTMWLNLYATRLTLANLGIEDMGVYGVIGSIVSLFTVFTGSITSAIQRFITFELGLRDGQLNKVFCSSLNILFILAGLIFILLEIVGLWMLHEKVNIPNESRTAAFWVFQFSVFTCIVNTINIPYNALIIAHEKMNAFAVISILQVILNFLAAYCLFLFETDRLLIYSAVLATASVLTRILYQIYCHRKFAETNYSFEIDVTMLRQIGKFAGVSTVSGGLQIIASQGLVFIINIVFGVAVNAVYSIALQLKNSVLSFALNVQRAISPQITKTYANGEMEIHKKLVYSGSKVEVFLIYLIMIPFLFKTREILALWLNDVPDHMVIFAQCLVFISLIHAAIGPIQTAVFATNKISKYLIIPDSFYLLVLPIGYFLGIYTKSPDILIYIVVIMSLLVCMMRLYYAHKVTSFSLVSITKGIIFPCILVAVLSILCCYILIDFLYNDLVGIILLYILNGIILFFAILCIGLTKNEQKTFFILIRKIRKNR